MYAYFSRITKCIKSLTCCWGGGADDIRSPGDGVMEELQVVVSHLMLLLGTKLQS